MIELPDFAACRALLIGDMMLDRYWFGDVERISPEAPVPVMRVARSEERPGGVANVAVNVMAIGGQCTLCGIVGDDADGQRLSAICQVSGVDGQLVVAESIPTTVKLRMISRNQQLLRVDFEQSPDDAVVNRCAELFRAALNAVDLVVVSDYGRGALRCLPALLRDARAAGKQVIVDPKGRDFERYRGAAAITPNRSEFEEVVGPWCSDEEMHKLAFELVRDLNLELLLLTLSDRGMHLYRCDGTMVASPARAREVYDVSGAGDTVVAVLAMCLARGVADRDTLAIANAAAGVVVGKLGTAVAQRDEIKRILGEGTPTC